MYPSLFNDVFGPVMIGPSSSAFAGPVRIAQLAHDLYGSVPQQLKISYIPGSGRAFARFGFSTDLGIVNGVLGRGPAEEQLLSSFETAQELGMQVDIVLEEFENHGDPDAMQLTLSGEAGSHLILGHSIGGGMIRISKIDDFLISGMQGEEYALLAIHEADADFATKLIQQLEQIGYPADHVLRSETAVSQTDAQQQLTILYLDEALANYQDCAQLNGVKKLHMLNPVMPVVTKKAAQPPLFQSLEEMIALAEKEGVDCAEIAIRYEMGRSLWTREEVIAYMRKVWKIIVGTVNTGLSGEVNHARGPFHNVFGHKYYQRVKAGDSILDPLMAESLISSLSAWDGYLDSNTLSVAGPAAGAPSIMSGALIPVANKLQKNEDDLVKAMFVAAAIGAVAYVRTAPTGEVTGCSGESGVGSAMAAGAIVQLAGGTPAQVGAAAAVALMNMFGLPCDTIAGGGCAMPCRGRTSIAPINSIMCAELAMAEFPSVVPYDQVLDALDELFSKTPGFMKGNGSAGIPTTPVAKEIVKEYTEWSLSQR